MNVVVRNIRSAACLIYSAKHKGLGKYEKEKVQFQT